MSKARAYSYIRFSSEKQAQGDSLRRQLDLANAYAEKHDLILDPLSYRDLGVSAFKGKNVHEGKLGLFIKAVDDGIIKPGSYLLVESLDRLSRDDVDVALERFLSIIRKGIIIVAINDNEALYSQEKIKNDRGMSLIMSILVMIRANEESASKSKRIKAAWKEKADKGDILTKICPAWMKHDGEKFVLIDARVAIVKRMFDLSITDGRGSPYIANLLNDEGIKPFGWADIWTNGTVSSILNNPATYGTLRRKKAEAPSIPNYYPAAVDSDTFLKASAATKVRQWKGGKKGTNVANLFSGMSYCGKCGSKMRVVSTRAGAAYLKCLRAFNSSLCDAGTVSVARIEGAVLDRLWNGQMRMLILGRAVKVIDPTIALRTELIENNAKLANLIKLASMTNDIAAIAKSINDLQSTIDKLQTKIKNSVVERPLNNDDLDETKQTMDALANPALNPDERGNLRVKLQAGMRRILQKVEMFTDKNEVHVTFASGNVRILEVPEIERYRVNGTFAKAPTK